MTICSVFVFTGRYSWGSEKLLEFSHENEVGKHWHDVLQYSGSVLLGKGHAHSSPFTHAFGLTTDVPAHSDRHSALTVGDL